MQVRREWFCELRTVPASLDRPEDPERPPGLGGYGYGYGGYGDINDRMRGVYGGRFGPRLYGLRFMKRDLEEDKEESEEHKGSSGSLLFNQFQSSECAADDASCVSLIPPQTVDMGSQVMIQPTNEILPTTTYQGKIESLESSIEAAPGMSSSLPQHNVNLGSNVVIQPVTTVYPDTTYQPIVNQLSTSIYAAEQYDESLPQSSVLLGSNVHIQPHVSVVPLTTFQPSIKSKPLIINVEPCSEIPYSKMPSAGVDVVDHKVGRQEGSYACP
ncbi:hypothetical protein BGZ51_003499 [Haplosporangium sp. Z 767]|nr:hypothetical protein BGZ51_003499 [Haplosporangium sp. Z 767]KAF9185615.1 hypothetical protein BGZ50_002970 [Haplosporangium sp. Z 11]